MRLSLGKNVFRVAAMIPLLGLGAAQAQTATGAFDVTVTIQADCEVTSTQTLNFGSVGVLTSNVDQQANLQVTCTPGTDYDIGLDEGEGDGATTTIRKMTSAADATVDYGLFQDAGRSGNWGDTVGTDTVGSTGTGSAQSFTVYGRIPPQATPAPGVYNDTITVTVTF